MGRFEGEMRANTFVISFANPGDCTKVMAGRPWLFDTNLFVLKNLDSLIQPHAMEFNFELFWIQLHNLPFYCMNQRYGELIGNTLGDVVYVDVSDGDMGWVNTFGLE